MKKHILSLLLFGSLSIYTYAQTYYVNENFNSGTLPTGWTNVAVSGSHAWSFGIDGSQGAGAVGNQNIDSTKFAYFDDDNLGGTSNGALDNDNTAALTTPPFNNSAALTTYLEFDYNFRKTPSNTTHDTFYVDVYDGIKWNRVYSVFADDCGNYLSALCAGNFPHASIDISAFKSIATKVRFTYYDGKDWGFYVGIDNVKIGTSLTSSIKKLTKSEVSNYQLYPNPSNGQFSIDVSNKLIGERFQILDLSGRVIQEGKINGQQTDINLDKEAKGIYIFRLSQYNIQKKVVVY